MSSVQIQRLQWLMEVISDYEPITFKEIQGKWDKCSLNCDCKPYAERTFRDHLKDIYDSFGISIKCNNYNEYYIDREGTYETGTCKVQCAYAPEFSATGKALKVEVK